MTRDPASEESAYFETLIEAWERKHCPLGPLDPVESFKFCMDQSGLTVADMVAYSGSHHWWHEVLNGKRPLTAHLIRRILTLGMQAQSLVGSPEPVRA